jgi:hypothetical protein
MGHSLYWYSGTVVYLIFSCTVIQRCRVAQQADKDLVTRNNQTKKWGVFMTQTKVHLNEEKTIWDDFVNNFLALRTSFLEGGIIAMN